MDFLLGAFSSAISTSRSDLVVVLLQLVPFAWRLAAEDGGVARRHKPVSQNVVDIRK